MESLSPRLGVAYTDRRATLLGYSRRGRRLLSVAAVGVARGRAHWRLGSTWPDTAGHRSRAAECASIDDWHCDLRNIVGGRWWNSTCLAAGSQIVSRTRTAGGLARFATGAATSRCGNRVASGLRSEQRCRTGAVAARPPHCRNASWYHLRDGVCQCAIVCECRARNNHAGSAAP